MKARVLVPFLAVLLCAALVHAQAPPPEGGGAPPAADPPAAAPPAAAPPAAAPPATPPPAAAAKPEVGQRIKGLMLIGAFGVDGCTDNWCDNVDPLVFLRVQAMYRFLKYIAAGLHLVFPFGHPEDEPSGYNYTYWGAMIGAEVRGIFSWRKLDFWTGLVFGWMRSQGDAENGTSQSVWFDSFGLGWGFGADYFLTPRIGLGFTFYLYKPFPEEVCADPPIIGTQECYDLTSDGKDDIGIWWTVGVAFTFFLPM